jgi:hypothetical protein
VSSLSLEVLAALADDRHRAIVRDFAYARHVRLRLRLVVAIGALADALDVLGRREGPRISR